MVIVEVKFTRAEVRLIKAAAAGQGITVQEFCTRALRKWLGKEKRRMRGIHNQTCCRLINYLRGMGIIASVGHGKRSSRSPTFLTVVCQNAADIARVPKGFSGYRVYATVAEEFVRDLERGQEYADEIVEDPWPEQPNGGNP